MRSRCAFISLLLFYPFLLHGQPVNNTLSYRNAGSDHYARLYYENDYFSATDYYYTQGIYLELVAPGLKKNPLNHLLWKPPGSKLRYGLAAEHDGYTPTSIESDTILTGDRPFAAALYLKSFVVAIDPAKRRRISTTLSIGLFGAGAGGYEMQDYIHRNTGNVRPHGWQYQMKNDLVLNYELNYEKNLVDLNNHLLINAIGTARIGTLSTKAALGTTIMVGFLDGPFSDQLKRKWSLWFYDHIQGEAIGYDATLQGGPFTHDNPYTIAGEDVNRLVMVNRYGAVFRYKWLYLEYYQRYVTKEFRQGTDHHTGGVQLGISL